jgi:hypothetical protein
MGPSQALGSAETRPPHPPYSPDLAPSDFFLFGHVKTALRGTVFESAKELLEAVTTILRGIPTETLLAIFHQWMDRLQTCIAFGGSYVE